MTDTEIVPFWQRLRAISTYPFRGAALYTIIALDLFSVLGNLPGVGFFILVLTRLATYKFAFEILRHTADGHLEPPEQALSGDHREVWRYMGLLILMGIAVFAAFMLGIMPGIIAMVLAAVIQPAATMSLAMDGDVFHALKPATWGAIINRIGGPYFALFGLLFVFQMSALNASALLASILPSFLSGLLVFAVSLWGIFATFHLMGYLIYQYHEELGFQPELAPGQDSLLPDRDRELLDEVGAQIQAGDSAGARARLEGEIRSRGVPMNVHDTYRRLLLSEGDTVAAVRHARTYLAILLNEGHEREALTLVRECYVQDPRFSPLPEQGIVLANAAERSGQSGLAVQLGESLYRLHPRNPEVQKLTLQTTRLMLERQARDGDSRDMLEDLRARAASDEIRDAADQQLELIAKLAGG